MCRNCAFFTHNSVINLNYNTSAGPDLIHPKIIFELRHQLAKPLADLFNLSLARFRMTGKMQKLRLCIRRAAKQTPKTIDPYV
jgi:hypothetical protein